MSKLTRLALWLNPKKLGIEPSENGWADTCELVEGSGRAGCRIPLGDLEEIVATNDKQRFKFSDDYGLVR